MENKGKNIDDLFRDGLGDYAETPPPAAWDRLQQQLKTAPTPPPAGPNRKFGYFALVALLLLLGASVVRNMAGTSQRNASVNVNEPSAAMVPQAKNVKAITATANNQNTVNSTSNNSTVNNDQPSVSDKTGNTITNDKTATATTSSTIEANHNNIANNKTATTANKHNPMTGRQHVATNNKKSNKNSTHKKGTDTDENDDEVVYNSAVPKAALKGNPALPAQEQTAKDKPKEVAVLPKASVKPNAVAAANAARKKKVRAPFNLFDLGIKAGYETGFDNDAAKKAVISPYVQLNLSPKLAVMLQPAIKAASLDSRRIGATQGYYKVNNDGKITQKDSSIIRVIEGGGIVDSLMSRDYTYSQTHDSIVKMNTIGGHYTEFELPVLLKYNISKSFSVYGGVNMVYSKMVTVQERTISTTNITKSATVSTISEYHGAPTALQPIDSVITYKGTPYSEYTGPQYSTAQSSQLRYGYMLGFTYQYNKRWLVDALVQQTFANTNIQGSYNINSTLSAAYLRVTLGYKLTK